MKIGDLSRFLAQAEHPYLEVAVLRAKYAQSKKGLEGYGLTKIPERVLKAYAPIPEPDYYKITDSAFVEANVLTLIDTQTLQDLGKNLSIQAYHIDSDKVDKKYLATIQTNRRKTYLSIANSDDTVEDVEFAFEGLLDLVDEVHAEYGSAPDQKAYTRLRNKVIGLIKRGAK